MDGSCVKECPFGKVSDGTNCVDCDDSCHGCKET